jgi:Pyridoxamine 5'-phosphate oxidase
MSPDPSQDSARDFEDVRAYTLESDDEAALLAAQTECTMIWLGKDGHPMGVIVNFIFRNGRFWLTATEMRPRIAAMRLDPRVSIAISSKGSSVTARQSVTYKGTAVLHTDPETLEWFVPEFAGAMRPDSPAAAESFGEHLRSPGRVVIELVPVKRVGFDSSKMWAAAPSAAPDA